MSLRAVFVVGTGRSGTHFTCRVLREFTGADDFLGGHEHRATLQAVALSAIAGRALPLRARAHYRWFGLRARATGKVLLDQHHPNLFHVPEILSLLPGTIFLFPDRPALQIVASMLRHGGVSAWYDQIRAGTLPLATPDLFFGLTSAAEAVSLPPHLLALRRVQAHRAHAQAMRAAYPDQFRFVAFESLVTDRDAELARVFSAPELAQLGPRRPAEASRPEVLSKYHDVLSPDQIAQIEASEARPGT